jgi:PAS domain S-box-containing protein
MSQQERWVEALQERKADLVGDVSSVHKLYRLSAKLLRPTDRQTALELILDGAMEIVGAPMGSVHVYDGARKGLEMVAQRGLKQEFVDRFRKVSTEIGALFGRAMAAGEKMVIEDIELDAQFASHRAMAAATGIRAMQSAPLVSRNETLAVVSTYFPEPHRPAEIDLRMLDLYLVHATDTMERIRAEEALRQSSDLYRAIGDSIPYGIWIADAEGSNTYVSDSFLALTGLTQGRCSGLGWTEVLHPDDATETRTRWQKCVRAGTAFEREHRVQGIDGKWHPILVRGVPVKNEAGRITAWVGINLDIGNRVRTRELARRQAQMLEETHDAIFQWEFDGGIVNWNRGAERLYGYRREEAMGNVPPVLLQTECDGGIEAVKAILQRDSIWNGELRHRTKDGREIFVESRMLLWCQPEMPPLITEANHDITDRKRAEMALRESEQKLRDQAKALEQQLIASGRLVSLGQVTASMAHEFNNPLGIIIGFVEDMLENSKPSDPDHRGLKIINDEAQRCKKIVEDLMAYARPRSAEMSMINIQSVVETTSQLVETHLYKQKVNLVKEVASPLPRIYADSQQLAQVLVNLFLNAIEAMPGGGTLTVGAKLDAGAGTVVLAVTDRGTGIEAAEIDKIFQPFYTAKKRRGLGLGLPICERIVKNHGGEIKVQSQPGVGTSFEIRLPTDRRSGKKSLDEEQVK